MADLAYKQYRLCDFSNQDLSKKDLSHSEFISCNFDNSSLEWANCMHSKFTGSTFNNTNCRYTNFAYSDLQNTKFFPSDAYGVVFSLECRTFKGMEIKLLWWYSYIFFSLLMKPEIELDRDVQEKKDPRDRFISAFGTDRFRRLTALFSRRGM